ncbi:putative DNA-binding domain protein [Brevibacillus laterosporus GI-9]|nr:putative DNA-binding domain protein [Brevibacillus laterosporus GI-9]
MQGLYEEAKKYVNIYADLGWFELLDDLGEREIEKFRIWGKANMYTLDLLLGNIGVLSEYIDFLTQYPNEHTAGFLTIMKSANLHNFSADDILERFSNEIKGFDTYTDPINISRHLHFRYQKALYEFRNKRISRGIDDTLRCLGLSDIVNHHQEYKRCVELLWKYRRYASRQQKEYFEAIVMKGGYKDAKIPTFFSYDNWINI